MSAGKKTIKTGFSVLSLLLVVAIALVWVAVESELIKTSHGVTKTWDGGGTDSICGGAGTANNISCAANWNDDTVPASGDDLVFDSGSKNAVWDLGAPTQLSSIQLLSGYTGEVNLNGRDLTVSGDLIVESGAWFNGSNVGSTVTIDRSATVGGAGLTEFYDLLITNPESTAHTVTLAGPIVTARDFIIENTTDNSSSHTIFDGALFDITVGRNLDLKTTDNGDVTFNAGTGGTLGVVGDVLLNHTGALSSYLTFNLQSKQSVDFGNEFLITKGNTAGYIVFDAGSADTLDVVGPARFVSTGASNSDILFKGGTRSEINFASGLTLEQGGTAGDITFEADGPGEVNVSFGDLVLRSPLGLSASLIRFHAGSRDVNVFGNVVVESGDSGDISIEAGSSGQFFIDDNLNLTNTGDNSADIFLRGESKDLFFVGGTFTADSTNVGDVIIEGGTATFQFNGPANIGTTASALNGHTQFLPQSSTVRFRGDVTFFDDPGSGTFIFTSDTETFEFIGTASQSIELLELPVFNITIANSGPSGNNTVFFDDNTFIRDVNGTVRLEDGVLDVKADSGVYTIQVAEDWINTDTGGSLNAQQGTVVLDGGDQRLLGDTTFYNLTKVSPGNTLTFGSADRTTVLGEVLLQGDSSAQMLLRRTPDIGRWEIDPQGTRLFCHLDVQWSENVYATVATCQGECKNVTQKGTVDNDTNINWEWDPDSATCPGTSPSPPGTATGEGNVFGFAWASTTGWISANSESAGDSVAYGVTVATTSRDIGGIDDFRGYAWSDNIGWISFNESQLAGCPNGTCKAQIDWSTGDIFGWARVLSCQQATPSGYKETKFLHDDPDDFDVYSQLGAAISTDGKTFVVGATDDDSAVAGDPADNSGNDVGGIFVYEEASGAWTRTHFLKQPIADFALQGYVVDISGDGSRIVASPHPTDSFIASTTVYVWDKSGGTFNFTTSFDTGASKGTAIALSDDGKTLIAGDKVWVESGGSWSLDGTLTASNQESVDAFPAAVDVNEDGTIIAVSATGEQGGLVPPADWWDADWKNRMKITLDATGLSGDLTGFPVMVNLPPSFNYASASSVGADVRLISDTITQTDCEDANLGGMWNVGGFCELYYEIDEWNVGGNSYVWVKMPRITAGIANDFWLYYGNAAALDAQNTDQVWYSEINAAWHMNDDPSGGSVTDHSGYGNALTPFGAMTATNVVSGKIGQALQFDGIDDFLERADAGLSASFPGKTGGSVPRAMTLSAWIKPDTGGGGTVMGKYGAGTESFRLDAPQGAPASAEIYADASNNSTSTRISVGDQWSHIALQWRWSAGSKYMRIWLDGVNQGDLPESAVPGQNLLEYSNPFRIANISTTTALFKGIIDEVHTSDVTLGESSGNHYSGDWIKCEYGNQVQLAGETCSVTLNTEEAITFSHDPADNSLTRAGAVYVFEKVGGVWTEQAYLKHPSPESEDLFGINVSVSGIHVAVGIEGDDSDGSSYPYDDANAPDSGGIMVFEKPAGGWEAVGQEPTDFIKVLLPDFDVLALRDMGDDGETILGAILTEEVPPVDDGGALYLFRRNGNASWTKKVRLVESDPGDGASWYNGFGLSADYSSIDTGRIVAGAPFDQAVDGVGTDQGSAYLFEPDTVGCVGSGWISLDSDTSGDAVSYGVSLDPWVSGVFEGFAWSDDFGWISFNNLSLSPPDSVEYFWYLDQNMCPFYHNDSAPEGSVGETGRYVIRFRGQKFQAGDPEQAHLEMYGHFTGSPTTTITELPDGAYDVTLAGFAQDGSLSNQRWAAELSGSGYSTTTATSSDIGSGTNVWQTELVNSSANGTQVVTSQATDAFFAHHNPGSAGEVQAACIALDYTCPFVDPNPASADDGVVVVNFRSPLVAPGYGTPNESALTPLPQTLVSGYYKVRLASYDGHSATGGDGETNEEWSLSFYNSVGTDFASTTESGDISDSEDFWSGLVLSVPGSKSEIKLGEAATDVRAFHSGNYESSPPSAGKHIAICASIELQPPKIVYDTTDSPHYRSGDPPDTIRDAIKGDPTTFDWEIQGPYDICTTRVGCPSNKGPDGDSWTNDDVDCGPDVSLHGQSNWLALDGTKPPALQDDFATNDILFDHWLEMTCQNNSSVNSGWSVPTVVNVFRLTECNDKVDNDGDAFCDDPAQTGSPSYACDAGTDLGDAGCVDMDDDDENHAPCSNAAGQQALQDGVCQSWWGENPINCPQDCSIKIFRPR